MSRPVLLIDAYSLIYRAFYAIRSLSGPDGSPVNAIYGFTKMLNKLLADHKPLYCAVVYDLGPPQQRLALLPSYKAQRPPTPPDLDKQLPAIREILQAMRLPVVESSGEEADDLIATLATQAAQAGHDVLIASNDKDFMQIVGPRIRMLRPDGKQTVIVDAAAVQARYGVAPAQIVDLLSLVGDAADNVPGIPGVGEKTAAQLLRKHGTLDNVIAHAAGIAKPELRDAIVAGAEQLRANRQLIRLRTDVALPAPLETLRIGPPDYASLRALFGRFGFKSLLADIEKAQQESRDLFAQD